MDDVSLSGDSVTSVTSAILDSGTSLLVGPAEDVKAIASKVVRLIADVAPLMVKGRRLVTHDI